MSDYHPHFKTLTLAVSLGILAGCSTSQAPKDPITVINQTYHVRAAAMLKHLSLSEKLDIISGPGVDLTHYKNIKPINLTRGKDVEGVAGYINGVKNAQLNIPATKLADGPAGLRIHPQRNGESGTFYATGWPIGSLLASTWNTKLVQQIGEAEGNEVKAYGVDFLLAPGMNIQRNPLLGRNFEYYSEDPVIAGEMSAAMVTGIQSNGVGATIKHFVANNAETNRFFSDSVVTPRALREIYLRGFQIAVTQGHPWALMSSYNIVNGTYANQRQDLMTGILRHEWGFQGLTMSDWFAGNVTGLATDFRSKAGPRDTESAGKQIKAGNNLIEPGGLKADLQHSLKNGTLTEQDVDNSVVAILTQIQKTPSFQHLSYSNNPDLNAHAKLARTAATEGMVLLKNDHAALPYSPNSTIAAFGTTLINTLKGGTGSGNVNAAYVINLRDGLSSQFTLDKKINHFYQTYWNHHKFQKQGLLSHYDFCNEPPVTDHTALTTLIKQAAQHDQSAVIAIARQAGEGEDRKDIRGDYLLTHEELALIHTVADAFHAQGKTVTVVLNVNGIVDTHEWQDKVDSILLAYMGGQETGYAVADILSGKVNPSGKLAQTIPLRYQDVPSANTFPGIDTNHDGKIDTVYYNEGIYVGYRYYTTFHIPVAFPFGYGLSYTTFNFSQPAITANTLNTAGAHGQITLATTVRNTGKTAGKEVAEVYVSAPQHQLKKPAIELKTFRKTARLKPGTSQTLHMTISAQLLSSFDPATHQWIIEPGTYTVSVGASSNVADARQVTFKVKKEIVVETTLPNALALEPQHPASSFITIAQ